MVWIVLLACCFSIMVHPVLAADQKNNTMDKGIDIDKMIGAGLDLLGQKQGPGIKALVQANRAINAIENIPLFGKDAANWLRGLAVSIPSGQPATGNPAGGPGAAPSQAAAQKCTGTTCPVPPSGQSASTPPSGLVPLQPPALPLPATQHQTPSQGSIGGACWDDGTCWQGECSGTTCEPCGRWGQRACSKAPRCEQKSEIVNGFCRIQSGECGHVGNPPCTEDRDEPFCYSGNYNDDGGICEDCGDYNQRCCPSSAYPCDYGECLGGICRNPDTTGTGSGIQLPDPIGDAIGEMIVERVILPLPPWTALLGLIGAAFIFRQTRKK
jgi:hypothetical protein